MSTLRRSVHTITRATIVVVTLFVLALTSTVNPALAGYQESYGPFDDGCYYTWDYEVQGYVTGFCPRTDGTLDFYLPGIYGEWVYNGVVYFTEDGRFVWESATGWTVMRSPSNGTSIWLSPEGEYTKFDTYGTATDSGYMDAAGTLISYGYDYVPVDSYVFDLQQKIDDNLNSTVCNAIGLNQDMDFDGDYDSADHDAMCY